MIIEMRVTVVALVALLVCVARAIAVTQPDAISDLAFWVKADAGVTTNASGEVTAWADQSGRGHNAAATATYEPDFVSSVSELHNMPALRFNNGIPRDIMGVSGDILTNGVEAFTIIAMAKADVASSTGIMVFRSSSGNPFVQLDMNTGDPRFIIRNPSGAVTANSVAPGTYTDRYGMFAGRLTKHNATTWTNELFFNTTTAKGTSTADFSGDHLTAGARYIGGYGHGGWDGDIAEIIIYERALSDSELNDIADYMENRYDNYIGDSVAVVDEVPGLALWLRADSGVSKVSPAYKFDTAEHNDPAQRWYDSSITANAALFTDYAPTFKTNIVNGLPAIEFTGGVGGDYDRYSLEDSIGSTLTQLTVFAICRQTLGATSVDMVFTHRNSGSTGLIQASVSDTDAILQLRDDDGSTGVQAPTAGGMKTDGTFNIVMWQFDAVNDIHAVAVNGGTEVQNTTASDAITSTDTQRIGWYYGGNHFGGHIAELIVYEGVALTFEQKRKIGLYLEEKYGLDTAYAPVGTLIIIQ